MSKQLYTSSCDKCWEEFTIKTQKDNHPEYYTSVYIQCNICNEWEALFNLPVN